MRCNFGNMEYFSFNFVLTLCYLQQHLRVEAVRGMPQMVTWSAFPSTLCCFATTPSSAGHALDDGWKASKRELLHLLNCFLNNDDHVHLEDDDDGQV